MAVDTSTMPPEARALYDIYKSNLGDRVEFEWDAAANMLSFYPKEGEYSCDFCGDTAEDGAAPFSLFQADDVLQGEFADGVQISQGAWSACVGCTPLIAGGGRRALTRRAIRRFTSKYGISSPVVIEKIKQSHEAFWRARQ